MRLDHVSFAAGPDGLASTAQRIGGLLGTNFVDGGIHPRFGTRNMTLPLAGDIYMEIVEVLDHPASDKAPFGQAVRARSALGGGWLGWVVAVSVRSTVEQRRGREAAWGNRRRPDGSELRWRRIGVNGDRRQRRDAVRLVDRHECDGASRLADGLARAIEQGRGRHEQTRLRIGQLPGELVRRGHGVGRGDDGAQARDRVKDDGVFETVRRPDGDHVAFANAKRGEAGGGGPHLRDQLAVRDQAAGRGVDERGALCVRERTGKDDVAERGVGDVNVWMRAAKTHPADEYTADVVTVISDRAGQRGP
jgi:hypothetical protein